jgi:hypothetical protein
MPPRAYVYYRVRAGDREACVSAVRELQAGWQRRWPDLQAEVLQRPEADDRGCVTLMEVYAALGLDDVLPAIEAEAPGRLSRWLQGPRHVERFVPCA